MQLAAILGFALTLGVGSSSSQEATPPQEPVHVAHGFMATQRLTTVAPAPIKADISGTMLLRALIGKDGHVKELTVISGPEMLRGSCIDAVRQWTYKPYLVNRQPVEVETFVEIDIKWGVPSPEQPIHVSGGIMAGTILSKSQPIFPCIALKEHVSGASVLHVLIGKDGHVKDISVISGPEALRAAVMDAVRQWTYRPYLLNDIPVEVDTVITISIQMGGSPYPQCP